MPPAEPFELIKWYLDAVAPGGQVFVNHWTTLRWRGFSCTWHSHATVGPSGQLEERGCLSPVAPPSWVDGHLVWHSPALRHTAKYLPLLPSFSRVLLDGPTGRVDWHCEIPAGRVTAQREPDPSIVGLGYAERIRLTMPPWRLPIRELRWGRWIADDGTDSLVWIDWRGSEPRTWIFRNGQALEGASVSDHSVTGPGMELGLAKGQPVRSRSVGEVIRKVPGLSALVPGSVLDWQEDRWVGRASLIREGVTGGPGWMLFERVVLG